ncbi:MAG: type III pantothenate kinase [Candidatus Methylumidiphilus sp.]
MSGSVLLVDIGNSRVKWGFGRDGRVAPGEPFATAALAESLPRRWGGHPPPSRIVACTVAGLDKIRTVQAWTERRWQMAPLWAQSAAAGFGVVNGYANPEKLGVDRWVALIGARRGCAGPVCVADCGTAITFDALDADGRHLGGWIAPGLALMRQSLARGTHGLPLAELECQSHLARDTLAGIVGGTLQAAAGLVERGVRAAARDAGGAFRLLLTGGDAPAIAAELDMPHELRPELVLEGLLAMAEGLPG